MPYFNYKGRTGDGTLVRGTIEAASSQAASKELLSKKIMPVDITESHSKQGSFLDRLKNSTFIAGKIPPDTLIMFCRQVNTLLRAGIPILAILQKMTEMTNNKPLKKALGIISEDVAGGQTLASAIQRHPHIFSAVFINLINTGESSGQLDNAFLQMASYIQLEADTKKRIKQATRYPMVVITIVFIAVIVINVFVVPSFADMFKSQNAVLPLPTRILMATSNTLINDWPMLLVVTFALVFAIRYAFGKNKTGRLIWHRAKLRLPIFGSIILRITLSRFARTLIMVTDAGVPINRALTLVAEASENDYVAKNLFHIRDQVERGASLYAAASQTSLFTPLVLQMLEIGEQTGMIGDMLKELADAYEAEVDYDLGRLGDLIEPVLLVILGALVLFLMLGVFLPLWSMMDIMKGRK